MFTLFFFISLESKIPEKNSFFSFCYRFWLVFILLFTIQYSLVFTYFPMNKMTYFIMAFFIFFSC